MAILISPRLVLLLPLLFCAACGPSVEDQVEKLGKGGEERKEAKQELLLAKDRAVAPLLQALEEPRYQAARPGLVEVLCSLMMRVDDVRLQESLNRHLLSDSTPAVRAAIARQMGLYKRKEAIPALLQAVADPEAEVRYQALVALGLLEGALSQEQQEALRERSRELVGDPHPGVQLEVMIRIEAAVMHWVVQAQQAVLQAQLPRAEALLRQALDYWPSSRLALYQLGRFYLDNGQQEKGLQFLRQHGMLLDVPRLSRAPQIDGRLDEAVWQQAARIDSFYLLSYTHFASIPADFTTRAYVFYTDEALYIGVFCADPHPDSLIVTARDRDGKNTAQDWEEDFVELFFDFDFDRRSYANVSLNSVGAVTDLGWGLKGGRGGTQDKTWNAPGRAAAGVGENYWSVEYQLLLGRQDIPSPRKGEIWGFNVGRMFRAKKYSEWMRECQYNRPQELGLLVFR